MVYIIAEIGVNWAGSKELAFNMIKKAKEAGASAVKFQMFSDDDIKHHRLYDTLKTMIVTPEFARELKDFADKLEIDWICTPFNLEAVDILNNLGVKYIKIREKDSGNRKLIDKALETGKTLLISAQRRPLELSLMFHANIRWLYCIPRYPPTAEDFADFKGRIEGMDGFSCHYPHIVVPLLAVAWGAKYLEVHVAPDGVDNVPDKNVSLSFAQLKELVDNVRLVEKLGLLEESFDVHQFIGF